MRRRASPDFLFLCGGGIIAHPDGPAAGVASLLRGLGGGAGRRGARSRRARARPELQRALEFFGARSGLSAWPRRASPITATTSPARPTRSRPPRRAGCARCCSCAFRRRDMLAAAGELDCVGIAGASRSMAPADMENELAPGRGLLRAARRAGRALQDLLDLRQLAGDRQHRGGAARAVRAHAQPLRPDRRRAAEHRALLRVRSPVRRRGGRRAGAAHRPAPDGASSGHADDRVRPAAAPRAARARRRRVGAYPAYECAGARSHHRRRRRATAPRCCST